MSASRDFRSCDLWETQADVMWRSSAGRDRTTTDELLWTDDSDCKYLRWKATGDRLDAASLRARDAFTSPSAAII